VRIVILGAGQVGSSVAAQLALDQQHEITIIDENPALLRDLSEKLDVRTVLGHASHPDVLEQAGLQDADLLLAVTNSDEVNMVACDIANALYHTPKKIARVRAPAYHAVSERLFTKDAVAIDRVISPEKLVHEHIARLIEHPGTFQVLDFANGKVRLVGLRANRGGKLVGHCLRDLRAHMPEGVETRVAAIFRGGQAVDAEGDTVVREGDEVFFIAAREHIRTVIAELRPVERPVRRVMIAGGGNVGRGLALRLQHTCQVKVIEHNKAHARQLAEAAQRNVAVLIGDAADGDLLREENIEDMDVFLAVTNDDEANILSAMLAKRLGAQRVMCVINRAAYVDLIEASIDIAISPHQVTIGALLKEIRRGGVVAVHALRGGAAEAIEIEARGDRERSRVIGRAVGSIKLPEGVTIAALVRAEQVLIAHHDTVIEDGDHVILFLVDRKQTRAVERLFQPAFGFL